MKTGMTSAPIIMQQELTSRCNNNCPFCYNPERCVKAFVPRKSEQKQNLAVAESSVSHGVMAACPTGGEPLIVKDHFFDVLSVYKTAGCYTSMNSNGRLITEKIAKQLADAGLCSALISIHGVGELHDSMVGVKKAFLETWSGIARLKEHGVSVTPNFVATAKNVHGLLEIGKKLAANGYQKMTVTPFLPSFGAPSHEAFVLQRKHYQTYFESIRGIQKMGIGIDSTLPIPPCVLIKLFPETWRDYLDVLSPRVCMAGKSFGVVSPDGQFRACIQAPYLSEFGGAMIENYTESWKRANRWASAEHLPLSCLGCQALSVCGGGCRTSCLWENKGSVFGSTMNMGTPLDEEDAFPFKERTVYEQDFVPNFHYSFVRGIKTRDEGWGVIVFNPKNQSFTILSKEKEGCLANDKTIDFISEKTTKVLLAFHAIEPLNKAGQNNDRVSNAMTVLPGDLLLPRLAGNLASEDKVYCLRADTGERYFF